ncbi:hypothetical protein K440DRAFT_661709 [Wilcoxina mikolae CBS 423.85]|nr:hypothetical protein K440DRAFT_661709 [Wilcoxina mikolae CBS 423.85]
MPSGRVCDLTLEWLLKSPINQRVHEIRGFRQNQKSTEEKLSALITALGFRRTSVEWDEALCLAALLYLDIMQIVQTPAMYRMAKFWSLLNTIPAWLLFHELPRLEIEGFRWAPRTLLRNSNCIVQTDHYHFSGSLNSGSAQITVKEDVPYSDAGLLAQNSGFIIETGGHPIGREFHARDNAGIWYVFDTRIRHQPGAVMCEYSVDYDSSSILSRPLQNSTVTAFSLNPRELHGSETVGFINHLISEKPAGHQEKRMEKTEILVSIQQEINGAIYGRNLTALYATWAADCAG